MSNTHNKGELLTLYNPKIGRSTQRKGMDNERVAIRAQQQVDAQERASICDAPQNEDDYVIGDELIMILSQIFAHLKELEDSRDLQFLLTMTRKMRLTWMKIGATRPIFPHHWLRGKSLISQVP